MLKLKRLWIIHLLISNVILSTSWAKEKEPPVYECVRWRYEDFVNFRVICLEWREKDCSNRLHKNLCKVSK